MTYAIRAFRKEDATALASLTLAAIHSVGTHRYTPEQVEVWASRHPGPERFVARSDAGAWIWVATHENDSPVAYALLEATANRAGHLDMLYCDPSHTRKGLAERLLTHAEEHARKQGMARLFTEASELARPAFERVGYAVQHRRNFAIEHEGRSVAIHNYAMEKPLS